MTVRILDATITTSVTICNDVAGHRYVVAIPLPKADILTRLRRAIAPPDFETFNLQTFVFAVADTTRLEVHCLGCDEEESVAELNRILGVLRRATL